jgi:[acyl-carrier-protein] S-malonyltransferase
MDDDDARALCREVSPEGRVGVAVVNGPGQTVISGEAGPLQKAMALASERGAKVLRLSISAPGHTPLMQDASEELTRFMSKITFRDPDPPLVSSLTGRLLTTAAEVRQELADQLCAVVEWARCVVAMRTEGASSFIEVGPGHSLAKMVRRITGDADVAGADEIAGQGLPAFLEREPATAAVTITSAVR